MNPRVLERIALTRLPELQVASGLFRATARIDGEEDRPTTTTLTAGAVVLLGLTRADESELEHPFSTGGLRTRVLGDLGAREATPADMGLALWAESRSDGRAVDEIKERIRGAIRTGYSKLPVEQLAWLVSGLTEAAVLAGVDENPLLEGAAAELISRLSPESALSVDPTHRQIGRPTPIDGQFHVLHSLCHLIRSGRAEMVEDRADRLAASLLELQRPDGAWPGYIDPVRAEAVAWYPVLTVTQVALAPMAFRVAEEVGLTGEFTDGVGRGLAWATGGNALGFNLIHELEGRIDRGLVPRREPGALGSGIARAGRRLTGRRLPEPDPDRLILDPAVSSEDLGWILEAWAGRQA